MYKATEKDFRFSVTKSGIKINAYIGDETEIIVPSTINNKPVVEIRAGSFIAQCDKIIELYSGDKCSERVTSVEIPDTVKCLKGTFWGCKNLEKIIIPKSIESIDTDCFEFCEKLKCIEVDENNSCFSSKRGLLFSKDGKELIKCPQDYENFDESLLEGVSVIGAFAFRGVESLTKIEIPENITDINDRAFLECKNLIDVKLHKNVSLNKEGHFSHCKSLERIIYFNSRKMIPAYEFESCCNLSEIHFNDKINSIGAESFENCKFKEFTIPDGCKSIANHAFSKCYYLELVVIPKSVKKISSDSFFDCGRKIGSETDFSSYFHLKTKFSVAENSYAEEFCREKQFITI